MYFISIIPLLYFRGLKPKVVTSTFFTLWSSAQNHIPFQLSYFSHNPWNFKMHHYLTVHMRTKALTEEGEDSPPGLQSYASALNRSSQQKPIGWFQTTSRVYITELLGSQSNYIMMSTLYQYTSSSFLNAWIGKQ